MCTCVNISFVSLKYESRPRGLLIAKQRCVIYNGNMTQHTHGTMLQKNSHKYVIL